MKIAIVSQPLDTIMPPYQNSVGACTYGVAQPLSESAEVLIYALKDKHESVAFLPAERNIDFHFFSATRLDRLLFSIQSKIARLFHRSSPISTSRWLFPGYGRMVAQDLNFSFRLVSHEELERETHDILGRNVPGLQNHTFQVLQIDPVLSAGGSVIYYVVIVR